MITADDIKLLTPSQLEEWQERSAIAEFDAKMPRTEAEVFAYNLIMWRHSPC